MNLLLQTELELCITLPASLSAAEEFFRSFRRQHSALCRNGEHFLAELILREALTNAIVHGCGLDPSKEVRCHLRRRGANLVIVVSDQGQGFDWRGKHNVDAESVAISGRGVSIFRKYATRFRYNAKGNRIAIWKKFEEETQHD